MCLSLPALQVIDNGGVELPAIVAKQFCSKPLTVRWAAALLWLLQRQRYAEAFASDPRVAEKYKFDTGPLVHIVHGECRLPAAAPVRVAVTCSFLRVSFMYSPRADPCHLSYTAILCLATCFTCAKRYPKTPRPALRRQLQQAAGSTAASLAT